MQRTEKRSMNITWKSPTRTNETRAWECLEIRMFVNRIESIVCQYTWWRDKICRKTQFEWRNAKKDDENKMNTYQWMKTWFGDWESPLFIIASPTWEYERIRMSSSVGSSASRGGRRSQLQLFCHALFNCRCLVCFNSIVNLLSVVDACQLLVEHVYNAANGYL